MGYITFAKMEIILFDDIQQRLDGYISCKLDLTQN